MRPTLRRVDSPHFDLQSLLKVNLNEMFPSPENPSDEENDSEFQIQTRRIVTYLDTYYNLNEGKYPSLGAIEKELRLEAEFILEALEEDGNNLLSTRGLPAFNCTASIGELDPEFVMACNLMADPSDKRSTTAKLKLLHKNTLWWTNSLKNRKNADYFRRKVEDVWDNELKDKAKVAVGNLIDRNDLNAVKYYHEYTGEFSPSQSTIINLQLIIQVLMEILAKHVGAATLASVADELEKSKVLEIGRAN